MDKRDTSETTILMKKEGESEITQEEIQIIRDILKTQAIQLGAQLYERCDDMNTFKAQVNKIIEKSEKKKE